MADTRGGYGSLEDYITRGREERWLEYKRGFPWPKQMTPEKAKVIRACLSLANIQDGGAIVIGQNEIDNNRWEPEGMSEEDARSWSQDPVQTKVNVYADPPVELAVTPVPYNGTWFVVIQVSQFHWQPVICRGAYPGNSRDPVLKQGGLYTRPRRKHESSLVSTLPDMRDITRLAARVAIAELVEDGVLRFLSTPEKPSDRELFDAQLRGV